MESEIVASSAIFYVFNINFMGQEGVEYLQDYTTFFIIDIDIILKNSCRAACAWSGRGNTPSEKTSSEYWPELVKKHDLGFLEDGHASKADLEEKFWEDLVKKTRCKKAGNSSKGRKKKPAVKFDHDCGMYRNKKRERRFGLVGKFGMFPSDDDDDDVVLMNPDPPPCQGTKDGNSVCENPDKVTMIT
ncbi:uncharacterized protein LOC135203427 [Macrobrachium nipponense]|uniref:uncharacterized protein LOC135203427 n=1 Tax=Macrobrachium nipponense TaxID=159736 RepID=UPI0030C85966